MPPINPEQPLDLDALNMLGAGIGRLLAAGDVVALSGELGAGKTSLARAILGGLGHLGEVPSPTFTLVQTYDHLDPPVAHVDLYRLDSAAEADALGLDDWVDSGGALLVEWPERLEGRLWPATLWLYLSGAGETSRRLTSDVPGAWEARWRLLLSN